VKRSIHGIVLGSVLIFSAGNLYPQEHGTHALNAPEEKRGMPQPGGAMDGMMGVMFRAVGACEQSLRSGAHGLRSHRLRSLLSIRKFCRTRVNF
jgi:hypothetical protein